MEYTSASQDELFQRMESFSEKAKAGANPLDYKIKVMGAGNMPATLNEVDPLDAVQAMDYFAANEGNLPMAFRDYITRKLISGKIIKFYLGGEEKGTLLLNDQSSPWNTFVCVKEIPYLLTVLMRTCEAEVLKKSLPPLGLIENTKSGGDEIEKPAQVVTLPGTSLQVPVEANEPQGTH